MIQPYIQINFEDRSHPNGRRPIRQTHQSERRQILVRIRDGADKEMSKAVTLHVVLLIVMIVLLLLASRIHTTLVPNQAAGQEQSSDYFAWSCKQLRDKVNERLDPDDSTPFANGREQAVTNLLLIMQLKNCTITENRGMVQP